MPKLDRTTLDKTTQLVHVPDAAPGFMSLSTPIHHASTVVFPTVEAYEARSQFSEEGYCYGLVHTPTSLPLAKSIAEWEGGHSSVLVPSGLSAISLTFLTVLKTGDHVLIPNNVYAPTLQLAKGLLQKMGIQHDVYDPLCGAEIAQSFRPNTRLLWVETPGSITMEVADLPAMAAEAHARGCLVAVDNTWSGGKFLSVFEKGADYSIQALTKYHAGHGDVLMGAVIARDPQLWQRAKEMSVELGLGVSPDDAFLVLRGMQTLDIRLEYLQKATLEMARWMAQRPEVARVLHPALPSCPGHANFQKDFTGSSSVFSVVLHAGLEDTALLAAMNRLAIFKMGASWGGTASLALLYRFLKGKVTLENGQAGGHIIRINIGMESVRDLQQDWQQAFDPLPR